MIYTTQQAFVTPLHELKVLEHEVTLEKTRLLYSNTAIGQIVTAINSGVLVFILGGLNPPVWALIWWTAMLAVAGLRFILSRRFRADVDPTAEKVQLWRSRAIFTALLSGVAWAIGSSAIMIAEPGAPRLFTALISAGMIAGAVPLLSSVQRAFQAYALPVSVVIAATAALDAQSRTDWMLAFVALLFLALVLRSSQLFHESLDRATRLALLMKELARRTEDSEQLFRTLAESTSTALFTYRTHFEYVNPAGERLTGYSLDELKGKTFWSIVHPDDQAIAKERGSRRLQGDEVFSRFEYRILTKNGEIRWIEFYGAMVVIEGIPTGLGSAFDITQHKLTEASLKENETKFHTMLDWTHDWEYWVNPDGRFNYMTPSVLQFTGYSIEEFNANPKLLDAIVHPDDRKRWERHTMLLHSETDMHKAGEIDLRILKRSGEIIWINHSCRPIHDADGRFLGRRVTARDITEQKKAEEEIRSLAYYDSLTRLPNRRLLMDRLGQALIAGNRTRTFGALMILDLDNFKSLNDTRGHDVGDRLLIEVARRLAANTREQDTVARLGGDEYVVLLEDVGHAEEASATHAEAIAEKIRHALNQPYRLDSEDNDYRSTTSIGLTLFRGQEISAEVLLKQADVALYQAKDAGRNQVRFFNPTMQAAIEARIALESALRLGIERDQLVLHYQPQVDIEGHLIGAEALVRWKSPERGLVSPTQFIPLAEDTGLILPIGEWVLTTACAQLKAWASDPRTRDLQIAVNVSAPQFHQPDFVNQVSRIIEASGATPSRLKLELTESVVLANVEEVIERMRQLDAMGVGFSMDDFGTGYSSLSYLKRLPLDQVKIDQSFVRDIPHDPNDTAIVRAILAMSESLGIQAIAEGVETEAQLDFLRANGCKTFQGYLFGMPMPIEQWQAIIDR